MNSITVITDNAIEWAKSRIGSTEFRFLCLRFVEEAIELSNNIEIFGGSSAKESADMYEAINQGEPPRGAFVFYDCFGSIDDNYKNWGHVGLSLGNGNVIHAWNEVRIDNYMEIENMQSAPGWSSPKFSGWVPIERVLADSIEKNWEGL